MAKAVKRAIPLLPTLIIQPQPLILGVDPSTKTGVCLIHCLPGGLALADHATIHRPGLSGIARAHAIASGIITFLGNQRPDLVVMEGYGYANAHSLATLVEIGTIIRLAFLQRKIAVTTLTAKGLKQWVSGNGNADKEKMKKAVSDRWGFTTKDDNQADAFGLATAGAAFLGAIKCTPSESEIISAISFLPCLGEKTTP